MLDLVLASVCVCVLACVGVSSAHFEHFHFQRSQPASHREVPFHRYFVRWSGYEGTDEEFSWVGADDLEHSQECIDEFHQWFLNKPGPWQH